MKQLIRHILREHTREISEVRFLWTKEMVQKEADKYNTRGEFKKGSINAYQAAQKYGWLEDMTKNMGYADRTVWKYDKVKELASTCKSRSELKTKSQSAYWSALKNGWLDEFFPPKSEKDKEKETYEKAKKESLKYKNRVQFQKDSPSLYNISRINGWLDEFIPKKDKTYNQSSTEEFIKKAKKVQGDKYDYSQVDYKNSHTNVNVNCKEHGPFPISPSNHLAGKGCPVCANIARGNFHRSNKKEFVKKAKEIFGDEYDYSLVDYRTNYEPVSIICPKHGPFPKSPANHLKGQGCPYCTAETEYRGSSQRLSKQDFILASQNIHGDEYDYSSVDYKNNSTPVTIICSKHGPFSQSPGSHVIGSGCPKCAGRDKTKEEFIKQAQEVQGDKYDYSKVDYKGARTKVNIICPKHGEFLQTPNQHLRGTGCPSCNESKGEKLINNLLIKHNVEQIRQKRFIDCTNKPTKGTQCVTLPFDFYLPTFNTIIEYDGQQHYVPVWGEDNFKRLQRLDKIRNQYCKKNGIKLIRIPYTMKKEEIEPYILKELGIK
jgi:hypothetical protein